MGAGTFDLPGALVFQRPRCEIEGGGRFEHLDVVDRCDRLGIGQFSGTYLHVDEATRLTCSPKLPLQR